jgi:hypothetical protein
LHPRLGHTGQFKHPAIQEFEHLTLTGIPDLDFTGRHNIDIPQSEHRSKAPGSLHTKVLELGIKCSGVDLRGLRIDTATLRTATQDVRDFGVVVSQADAAQIERTNDALSEVGRVFEGLRNQIAVALASGKSFIGPTRDRLRVLMWLCEDDESETRPRARARRARDASQPHTPPDG